MINLFDHNFDLETKQSVHRDLSTETKQAADLKEALEAARQEGFDAGRTIGRQDALSEFEAAAASRLEQERQIIQERLAELAAQDAQTAAQSEHDIVELFLGIAERLVPELINSYGPTLAVEHIRQAVRQSRTDPVLSINAGAEVVAVLESESGSWLTQASEKAQIELISDPDRRPGSVDVHWKGGHLEYDLESACTVVLDALKQAAKDYNEAT